MKKISQDSAGTFVIADAGGWLPGVYDSRETAQSAFQFSCEALEELQDAANLRAGGTGGVITSGDLQAVTAQQGATP